MVDGVWTPVEESITEFGQPEPRTVEEPTVQEAVEAVIAPPPVKQGSEVIAAGIQVPTLPPMPVFPPKEPDLGAQARKRKADIAQFNAAVLARILPELCEW